MSKTKKMQILQVGYFDWSKEIAIPDDVNWNFFYPENTDLIADYMEEEELNKFSAIIIDDVLNLPSLFDVQFTIEPYTILYNENTFGIEEDLLHFIKLYQARPWNFSEPEELVYRVSRSFWDGQYGDKLPVSAIDVHHSFGGSFELEGNQYLVLDGHFGEDFKTLATWRYNQMYYSGVPLEMWLEYEKEGSFEFYVKIQFLVEGALGDVFDERIYTEADLGSPILIDYDRNTYLSISVKAKGEGILKLGALHARHSRMEFGKFLLGGEVLKDSNRQEVIAYFHPGDLKPPLNVYFSGYRSAEGFEGFYMMRSFGAPFLLIGDPRLEGGSFYMGSEELESQIVAYIQRYIDYLGFTHKDLTLSGLSMGTFGALYYGADFNPHAIVVGKPLVNVGDIAKNLKLKRPDEFGTSLDMMKLIVGENSVDGIGKLNQKFWTKFEKADFTHTVLALAYMRDDDYDKLAYHNILEKLYNTPVRIISKSKPGRHNDASSAIVEWFFNQYKIIMETDFGREYKND